MTTTCLSTRQRLPSELMSLFYLRWQRSDSGGHRGLAVVFHTVLMAPGSLSLDSPQNTLVRLGMTPSTQLLTPERTVSRSKVEKWKWPTYTWLETLIEFEWNRSGEAVKATENVISRAIPQVKERQTNQESTQICLLYYKKTWKSVQADLEQYHKMS